MTSVVLADNALGLVAAATDLAHALRPAVVVLEDVDLIAEHREMHMGPQPLRTSCGRRQPGTRHLPKYSVTTNG